MATHPRPMRPSRHMFTPAVRRLLALLALLTPGPLLATPHAMDDQAFQAAQWMLATSTGQALAQLGPRLAAGDDALGAQIRDYQDALEGWQRDSQQLRERLTQGPFAESEAERDRLAALRQRIDALETDIYTHFPLYRELANPQPLDMATVQQLLQPREGLWVALVSGRVTDLWLITREQAQWQRIDLSAEQLTQWVRRLRNDLAPPGGEAPERFDRALAHQLYMHLLGPFEAQLQGLDQLLYVPDGPLTSLPLALLIARAPQGADDDPKAWRDTDWLINHLALAHLPTVGSLRALRGLAPRQPGGEPFRGYGDPNFDPGARSATVTRGATTLDALYRGGQLDLGALHNLPSLPNTRIELTRMAKALDAPSSAIFTGDQATERAVRSADLSRVGVLAFATHGLVAGELDGVAEPALALTPPERPKADEDGLLSASEAARLRLDADWVVLSACNTAAPDGTPGADGLSGLARAFLYAGARAVLASHWPVRDDATARLTSGTFTALSADPSLTRAQALRQSMLALIAADDDPSLAHPEAWAPFEVIGEGGR